MKAYHFKAIAYPVVGILHIAFWKYLPNPVLAAVIATLCFLIGLLNFEKWIQK